MIVDTVAGILVRKGKVLVEKRRKDDPADPLGHHQRLKPDIETGSQRARDTYPTEVSTNPRCWLGGPARIHHSGLAFVLSHKLLLFNRKQSLNEKNNAKEKR